MVARPILWLASWYPSKLDRFTGDFIQRHAQALALYTPVHVVFVVRDKKNSVTSSIHVEETTTGQLTETIIYYASPDFPVGIIEKFISARRYKKSFENYFRKKYSTTIPAIVHVHVPYKAGILASWIKKYSGTTFFLTEHWAGYDKGNPDNFWSRSFSFRMVMKRIFADAHKIVPVSADLAQRLASTFGTDDYQVIPNTVNDKLYKAKAAPDQFQFVHYASPVTGHKNTEGVIRALANLVTLQNNWTCKIYGYAGHELKKMVQQLNLQQKVSFTGELTYEQVAAVVGDSSAFISFSNYENQPCSILEALCCGLPIIATRVGGIPEIINKSNGILIDAGNEEQLFHAMNELMINYNKYNRADIAEASVALYGYKTVGKKFTDLYKPFSV